ncbi:MAG: hypothetical protein U0228_22045 [Myxococcaceae bacterium]
MAQVTLRDLSTNEDIVVPPEGFIFGRVGGDADVQLEDNAISRRQARVSLKGGQWLLETIAVPQGQKAPRPLALQEGATFNVGQAEFEVVQIEADDDAPDEGAKTVAPPSKGKPGMAPPPGKKAPPPPPNAKTTPASAAQKRNAASSGTMADEEGDAGGAEKGGGDAPPEKGFAAMFVAAPKGLAYYLLNVPKLMVNPIGSVRKQIEEMPQEPMGRIELIGYALPSLLFAGCLGSIARGLAMLIGPGHHFDLMSFIPIGPLIGGFIGAIVTGYIWHPLTSWVLTKLKGKHDARSRSNYFLAMMTVALVVAVPNAIGTIVASLPIPFINALGPLLMVVGSLASLYVLHQWMAHFEVVKWVLLVVKILAVLALLGAGLGFVQVLIADIKGLGSGGGGSAAVATTDDGDAEAAAEGDEGALEEMPKDPAEAKAWAEKRQKQMLAKAEAAKKAALAKANAPAEGEEKAEPAPKKEDPKKTEAPAKTETKAEPKNEKPEPKEVAETPPPPPKETVKETPAPKEAALPPVNGAYGAFARKRDAIERLFEADPTILQKSGELQILYANYLEASYDLDKKWGKETSKKPERAKLNARLHDAELFGKAGKTIDELAEKLKIK